MGCRLNIRKSTLFVNGNLKVPVFIPPFALLKPNAILLPSAAPYRSSPQPSSSSLGHSPHATGSAKSRIYSRCRDTPTSRLPVRSASPQPTVPTLSPPCLVHVGADKSMNSCDAVHRIVDCTLEQSVSPYQRVVYADVYYQQIFWCNAFVLDQVDNALDKREGLAGTRTGNDQQRAVGGGNGLFLGEVGCGGEGWHGAVLKIWIWHSFCSCMRSILQLFCLELPDADVVLKSQKI